MIVNPVVYGSSSMEICTGISPNNTNIYYFDGENCIRETYGGNAMSAPKNSIMVVSSSYALSASFFKGLTILTSANSGRTNILRVDSDFSFGG